MNAPKAHSLRCTVALLALGAGQLACGQATPASTPAPAAANEEVVQLETFRVSTTLGTYTETTSMMAAKVAVDMKDIASSLQILNANAIGDRKALNLADLYPYVVGMTRESNNANGFTIRGFSNSGSFTQNIIVDGLMGITSSRGSVSTAQVDRLEILKGPNSVLYGQMNPGGMINIVTKRPQERRATTVTAALTSYAGRYSGLGDDTGYVVTVDHTGPIDAAKHWLYRVVVSGQDADLFRKNTYQRAFYIYPSLTYRWSPRTSFTMNGEISQEKRAADDGLLAPRNDLSLLAKYNTVYQEPTDVDRDYGASLGGSFNHEFANKWVFRAQTRSTWQVATRDRVMSTVGQAIVVATPLENSTVRRRYQHQKNGHRYNYFDLNLHGDTGPENFRHTWLLGTGGGVELVNNRRLGFGPLVAPINIYRPALGLTPYPADGTGAKDPYNTIANFGVYVSDQIRLGRALRLSLGVRRDQQNTHADDRIDRGVPYASANVGATLYQAGLVYALTGPLSLYASYSESFKPQDVVTIDASGRTGFPPETARQLEGGFKFETPDRKVYATLAAYQIKKQNIATNTGFAFPPTGQAINRIDGEQTSEGVELEANWQPRPHWQLQAGGAYMKARITESATRTIVGKDLANAPRATANLWTRYNFPSGGLKGVGLGLGLIYVGNRYGGSPDTTSYFVMPNYTRVDTSLYYQWRRTSFALNLANTLDEKYIASARVATVIVPGDPRKLTLTVRTSF